jgi:hypothetical protein
MLQMTDLVVSVQKLGLHQLMVVWDGTSTIQYYHQSVQMSDFSQNN